MLRYRYFLKTENRIPPSTFSVLRAILYKNQISSNQNYSSDTKPILPAQIRDVAICDKLLLLLMKRCENRSNMIQLPGRRIFFKETGT